MGRIKTDFLEGQVVTWLWSRKMRSSPTGEGRSKGPFEKSTDREREIRQEPQHNISKKYQRL